MNEHWIWRAEATLCLELPPPPDPVTQRRLLAMAEALRGTPGLVDAVPGLHSLTLFADLAQLAPQALEAQARQAWQRARPLREAVREMRVPVRYGGEWGPDLPEAAESAGLSASQLIEAHAAPRYEVACLGFLPGFAYLLGLPPALHLPRRATPRTVVPAGSVGIGGAQTGIYPVTSPGGWQLIGRTDLRLFDPHQDPPTRLLPGDALRFEPLR